MSDNLSRNICDDLDVWLWEAFSGGETNSSDSALYLFNLGPITDPLPDEIKVFLPGLLRNVQRAGVGDMARVPVEGLRNDIEVLLPKSPTQLVNELDLW